MKNPDRGESDVDMFWEPFSVGTDVGSGDVPPNDTQRHNLEDTLFKDQLNSVRNDNSRLEETVAALKGQLCELHYQLDDNKKVVASRDGTILDLKDQLQQLESKYSAISLECEELKQTLSTQAAELKNLKDSLSNEKPKIKQSSRPFPFILKELKKYVWKLEVEVINLKGAVHNLTQENKQYKTQLDSKLDSVNSLSTEIKSLKSQVLDYKEDKAFLESVLVKVKCNNELLKNHLLRYHENKINLLSIENRVLIEIQERINFLMEILEENKNDVVIDEGKLKLQFCSDDFVNKSSLMVDRGVGEEKVTLNRATVSTSSTEIQHCSSYNMELLFKRVNDDISSSNQSVDRFPNNTFQNATTDDSYLTLECEEVPDKENKDSNCSDQPTASSLFDEEIQRRLESARKNKRIFENHVNQFIFDFEMEQIISELRKVQSALKAMKSEIRLLKENYELLTSDVVKISEVKAKERLEKLLSSKKLKGKKLCLIRRTAPPPLTESPSESSMTNSNATYTVTIPSSQYSHDSLCAQLNKSITKYRATNMTDNTKTNEENK